MIKRGHESHKLHHCSGSIHTDTVFSLPNETEDSSSAGGDAVEDKGEEKEK